ncbi:hypothetical protein PILCRDRAFT_10703 [Piloderma croceum F 1598]|uniref:Uncharacterized protein n=1 Tax=Piloderma croceum (strain F 1598) TaxID=765440 RepID=A0A0C3FGF1_PILCF|nr:hypothetical protein PILCRDRAFT_10703 [Piloderma croceum F 1598]
MDIDILASIQGLLSSTILNVADEDGDQYLCDDANETSSPAVNLRSTDAVYMAMVAKWK